MRVQREHLLQRCLKEWVAQALDAPHLFQSFDAARKSSPQAWAREKSRGVIPGCADTLLLVQGMAPVWAELKAEGNKPTEPQQAFGLQVTALGCSWFWCNSIHAYFVQLQRIGVPLKRNAEFLAEMADAKADGLILKASLKAPAKATTKRTPRYTAGKRLAAKLYGL